MKRIISILAAVLLCTTAFAQKTLQEYRADYLRQVQTVGRSGLGVDYILSEWEKAYPDNMEVRRARFNYWLDKGLFSNMEVHPGKTYLGAQPSLQLKDSLGNPVYYYEVRYYEDEAFSKAMDCADMSVAMFPRELRYRFDIINALMEYEHASPDMAVAEINKILDEVGNPGKWTLDEKAVTDSVFNQCLQELCFNLFNLDTPVGYEAFYEISLKMSAREPKNADWQTNQGAYWQKAKQNYKKAQKCYKKALKLDPDNYAAQRNLKVIERTQKLNKNKK